MHYPLLSKDNNLYLPPKEAIMARSKVKAVGKLAETARESARMRAQRIDGSQNGATLRTRIVRDKTKYSRTLKHKKSLADAGDFRYTPLGRAPSLVAINFSF